MAHNTMLINHKDNVGNHVAVISTVSCANGVVAAKPAL